ncbi:HAUS augmin-like complex subunit 6 isoform X2 [Strigops habroptila]|uniref:HAUS augmin like complex subunit 6 n=1 Tax=Strigops habroptila TaxID=2489341 RepID=A0A672VC83_STRHB|nr:HAUS augmin-like complex subunit 6 isoform X2 [Strigops habroptila]
MGRRWQGRHLWFYLLALGFKEEPRHCCHLVLGPKMFNVPNTSALHVVATFLFKKLDPARAALTFRNCGFAGPCFVKQCFIWLKDIEKKHQGCLQQVTSSSLISPGGPKFIRMFYSFARHVLVEDMKKNSVGADMLIAKAVKLTHRNMYMAKARCRVAYNKLLQIFVKEHLVIQEYQKKAWLLIKDKKQIQSEYAVLQTQSWKMERNVENKNDKTERIQKVRSMWTLVMEMLTSLKKEKQVVDSVLDALEDGISQCILDGTKVVVSVPQLLSHRVENDVYQRCTGNVYEDKNLNFLTVIQLLNEALRTLRDEHCQSELEKYLCVFENRLMCHRKSLQGLKVKRLEIEQQRRVSSESISREQENWEVKWKSFLGLCPFYFSLNQDRDSGLTAFQHHSSRVAEEDEVFCQHLLSVSDVFDSVTEESCEKDDWALETMMDKSTPPWISSVPLEISKASENTDLLTEKVVEAVVSESTQSGERKEMALEDLINSLCFDPFITRKQIPRTPENLLTEIRRSWRKAVQTEDSSDTKLNLTEVTIEEAPVDATPILQKVADSRFVCFDPASPVPDFHPALSESKSQLSYTEFRPQKQMRVSHIESPVSEASGMQVSERTEAQGLKDIVLNKSSVDDLEEHTSQYVKSIMNTPDVRSENSCGTNVLPSDRFQGSLVDGMLHWNVSSLLNSVSGETACLGILGETLEGCLEGEEFSNADANKSASSASDFDVMDSPYVTGVLKNEGGIKRSQLDLQSLFNPHKALKKTLSTSEEELHQILNRGESVSSVSAPSLAPEKRERDEFSSPQELFFLDEEFTKTPSPKSLNERKYSLSSLLVSCQHLEEMASMLHEIPLDLKHKLKDKEHLDEEPAMKEPSSG